MATTRYLNFPIALLDGFLDNPRSVLNNICDYAMYQHSLKLEFGDEVELIKSSANYFNIRLGNNENSFTNGQQLYDEFSGGPMTGLNLDIFWDFYNNDKSEFDKVSLLGFLAIKSILGNKAYCKIDNKFWLSRMSGYAKSKEIQDLGKQIQKYSSEYQTKKIKTELKRNWGLKTYSRYTRGFYVSFKLTLEDLIFEAEKKRKSVKDKQSKIEEKLILDRVLKKLNNDNR